MLKLTTGFFYTKPDLSVPCHLPRDRFVEVISHQSTVNSHQSTVNSQQSLVRSKIESFSHSPHLPLSH
ncbi:hypothetical protein, partial [Tychonema sp. LEGE 07196]